jgi:hypothetical protein
VDTVAVLRLAIRDYTLDGMYDLRVGVDARATGPAWLGSAIVDWAMQRTAAVHSELLATQLGSRRISGSASVHSQPQTCNLTELDGRRGTLCDFRNFDLIMALSTPVFRGDSATVILTGFDSPWIPRPGSVRNIAQQVMRHVLMRTGGSWRLATRMRIRGS